MRLKMYHVEGNNGKLLYGRWDHVEDAKRWARAKGAVVREVEYEIVEGGQGRVVADYTQQEGQLRRTLADYAQAREIAEDRIMISETNKGGA